MARVVVLFAHPALEKSRVHRRLLRELPSLSGITFNDLYEHYPDFNIDVTREQALLLEHDLIILQYPLFWYSTPAILKQWFDLVLEHGWAYGSKGNMLRGKRVLNVVTTGGGARAYQHEGYNRFTVREFLTPVEQSFRLCKMVVLPPFVIHGTHQLTAESIEQIAGQYRRLLTLLQHDRIDSDALLDQPTLNVGLGARLEREER